MAKAVAGCDEIMPNGKGCGWMVLPRTDGQFVNCEHIPMWTCNYGNAVDVAKTPPDSQNRDMT
jgi:hypothetical protein